MTTSLMSRASALGETHDVSDITWSGKYSVRSLDRLQTLVEIVREWGHLALCDVYVEKQLFRGCHHLTRVLVHDFVDEMNTLTVDGKYLQAEYENVTLVGFAEMMQMGLRGVERAS
jgi:hypothetical protein